MPWPYTKPRTVAKKFSHWTVIVNLTVEEVTITPTIEPPGALREEITAWVRKLFGAPLESHDSWYEAIWHGKQAASETETATKP